MNSQRLSAIMKQNIWPFLLFHLTLPLALAVGAPKLDFPRGDLPSSIPSLGDEELERFVEQGLLSGLDPAGWDRFQVNEGSGFESRKLFARLYRFDPEFLRWVEPDPAEAVVQFERRLVPLFVKARQRQNRNESLLSLFCNNRNF